MRFNIKAVCLTPEKAHASSVCLCLTGRSSLLCRQARIPLTSLGLIAHTKIRCLRDFQTEVSLLFMSGHEAAWSRKAGCLHAWMVSTDSGSYKPPLSLTPHGNPGPGRSCSVTESHLHLATHMGDPRLGTALDLLGSKSQCKLKILNHCPEPSACI